MERILKHGLRRTSLRSCWRARRSIRRSWLSIAVEKGLCPEQILAWRAACRSANASASKQSREQRHQSKDNKKRIRQLEKELQRKERALAEAAALLILRKKAQAIWGDKEDD
jgi:hypothetical protein